MNRFRAPLFFLCLFVFVPALLLPDVGHAAEVVAPTPIHNPTESPVCGDTPAATSTDSSEGDPDSVTDGLGMLDDPSSFVPSSPDTSTSNGPLSWEEMLIEQLSTLWLRLLR